MPDIEWVYDPQEKMFYRAGEEKTTEITEQEENEMAVTYATLIVNGKRTFADVPALLREKVRQVLIDIDCGELATA